MSKPRRPRGPPDYEVGYGRPPAAGRFKPGCSGNPKGRPRKRKTVGDLVEENLCRRVKIEEGGRTRVLPAQDIIVRQLVNKAAKGNMPAVKMLLAIKEERDHAAGAESVNPQDLQAREILDAYVARRSGRPPTSAAKSDERDPEKPSQPAASDAPDDGEKG